MGVSSFVADSVDILEYVAGRRLYCDEWMIMSSVELYRRLYRKHASFHKGNWQEAFYGWRRKLLKDWPHFSNFYRKLIDWLIHAFITSCCTKTIQIYQWIRQIHEASRSSYRDFSQNTRWNRSDERDLFCYEIWKLLDYDCNTSLFCETIYLSRFPFVFTVWICVIYE